MASKHPSYTARTEKATNAVAKQLLKLMDEKKTNLALADDETDAEKFLALADRIGPEIAVLKTHIDAVENFTPEITGQLVSLAKKYNFIIFEDRKFADIGNTVQLQYEKGMYHIVQWAEIVNAHIVPGPGIIEGLKKVADKFAEPRSLILLAQMSSKGNLATETYMKKAVKMAEQYPDFVIGFIGNGGNISELKKLAKISGPQFIIMTPGVNLDSGTDALQQQYTTPEKVIAAGSDVIVVGRGIYGADNALAAAQQYRQAGWQAYQRRLGI